MTAPLRVLHVLDHSQPLVSGYTMRSRSIIHLQPGFGITPIVLTSPRHRPAGKSPPQCEEFDGITYYRSQLPPSGMDRVPFLREQRQMRYMHRRISEIAQQERVSLIHAHSPSLNGMPAWRAARQLGIPIVYEIRALWEDAAVDQGKFREGSPFYRLSRWYETRLAKRVDHLCVICEGLRRDFLARGIPEQKISLMPNGVEIEQFQPPEGAPHELRERLGLSDATVLGFIGSFYRYEGLSLLIEAFKDITRAWPRTRLLLVGGGEVEEELRAQVQDARLEDKVILTGRVPPQNVRSYYDACDLLIYPRLKRRITDLTTPLKPLEAMSMGKLVIGSDVGGIAELVTHGKTGYLFQADSRDSLVETVARVLQTPEKQEGIRRQATNYVRNERQWPTIVSGYASIYRKVLDAS